LISGATYDAPVQPLIISDQAQAVNVWTVRVVVQFGIAQCELSAHWETLRALGDKRRKGAYTDGQWAAVVPYS